MTKILLFQSTADPARTRTVVLRETAGDMPAAVKAAKAEAKEDGYKLLYASRAQARPAPTDSLL